MSPDPGLGADAVTNEGGADHGYGYGPRRLDRILSLRCPGIFPRHLRLLTLRPRPGRGERLWPAPMLSGTFVWALNGAP